jgi:hypothetical protein
MLKQISFKTPEEASVLFDSLFALAVAASPALTKGAFFEEVVNGFANPKTKEVSDPQQAARIEELEKLVDQQKLVLLDNDKEISDCLELSTQELNFLIALRTMLNLPADADGAAVITEIRATQQRAMNALTEQRPLSENEILFTIPDVHLKLLNETVKRLTEKYKNKVTIKDVLLDMFARYTIDQLNEWFYPFVIKGDEDFKAVTGYTQKQLQAWLKKQA